MYKAERGERLFAIKFLADLELTGWNRREITLMLRLQLPNVVGFRACERWPHPDLGYPYIVMDYVPGVTMDQWAQRINPTARVGMDTFLKVARAMREVHRLEVLHRDLKETNIMIRADDGEPVVIDFGFGAMKGVPTETKPGRVPPGTPEYRSPEMIKFLRGEAEEIIYTYTLSDELWAMGVLLYWLLTDELPFGERTELGLQDRILRNTPREPHAMNPRVPEAASRLCMRMLAKDPRERFKDDDELCAALEAVLAAAEGDASWDVPLMEPPSPHEATVEGNPDEGGKPNEEPKDEQQWMAHKPQRGWKPEEEPPVWEEPATAPPDEPPRPAEANPATAAVVPTRAPIVAADIQASHETEAAAARHSETPTEGTMAVEAEPGRARSESRGMGGASILPLGVAVMTGLAVVAISVGSMSRPTPPPEEKRATHQPYTSTRGEVTTQAAFVREVAQSGNPAEAISSAAPDRAQPPAPSPTTMLRKKESRLKSEEKPTPQQRDRTSQCIPIAKQVCTAAGVCTIILTGCSGAQVRPEPASVECPAGWYETHTRFGLIGWAYGRVPGYRGLPQERPPLREGPFTLELDGGWEKLPSGTLLNGTLVFGENRFFGRFTQAQTPDRQTYPICVEIYRDAPADYCPVVGAGDCPSEDSRPGNFKGTSILQLLPTNRFQ
ncbi:protein kinase [Archangium violaceum]|uniref:serine/threonine protein kinase n=1 Tax=Archangium violaceum TaxID=83451 RepID=UPI001951FAA6|nr:serine/threonine-protein kinase [Archangium violaceum]QRN99302.1 protein kinase [Archangium violaceum]